MILVTGGTGLVGSHLLYLLLKDNKKVRALHREKSDLNAVRNVISYYCSSPETTESLFSKIEWVVADITEIPSLTKAFEGITHVYHCAAYISFDPKKYRLLKKTNAEGTANIVNLCLQNKIQKLCYVSSIATLGTPVDHTTADEENHWNPEENNNVYAITKFGAEMEVWRGIQEGLSAVIVNPGVILGEGYWDSGSGKIIKNAAKGIKYYTHGSSGFVDVQDVVQVMALLMERPINNERYILVGQNAAYREVLAQLSQSLGKNPPTKSIGRRRLLFLSKLDGLVSFVFRRKRKLLKPLVESLCTKSTYSAAKIEKTLDFTFTPLSKTIERVANNYSS